MIVVDTNIISYLIVTGERTSEAHKALRKIQFGLFPISGVVSFVMC